MKKLNLKPFEYGLKVIGVYDDGQILPQEVININPDSIIGEFQNSVKNLAGLSLATGFTIEPVIPLLIADSFKNIAALSIESGFKIKELEGMSSGPVKTEAPKETAKGGKKE